MTTLENLRAEIEQLENVCSKEHGCSAEVLQVINKYAQIFDKYAEQELNRDIKEIEEILKCDANAETKCKMISNILTAKPHYFEKQNPCNNTINKQAVDTLIDELARAISDERCCISRGRNTETIMQDILDLPLVKPQELTGHWIDNNNGTISCSNCHTWFNKDDRYSYMRYCPYCNIKMAESEPEEGNK